MPPFRPRRSLRPLRARLPRRALAWYAGAAALTVLTGLTVHSALARAAEARAAYGTTVPVAVVHSAVTAGEDVGPGDVAVLRWPRALVPPGALADDPTGRTALVDLHPGEPLLAGRVSDPDAGGPAALLAPGQRAIAVPLAVPGLPLAAGDRVDLLGGGAPGGGPDGDLPVGPGPPTVVAADATVLSAGTGTGPDDGAGPGAGTDAVVVAVTAAQAGDVAAALTSGPVVAALRPPGG